MPTKFEDNRTVGSCFFDEALEDEEKYDDYTGDTIQIYFKSFEPNEISTRSKRHRFSNFYCAKPLAIALIAELLEGCQLLDLAIFVLT